VIIPIHKKGATSNCENYRAICLSSTVFKAFTRILENRLRRQVEEELEEEQAAFRPGRQTQDWIYLLRAINEKITSRGGTINSLDLKATFERVPRVEIWNTLEKRGISKKLLRVIKSTCEKVEGVIRLDGKESETFKMETGVKQGDSLSPLLFITMMDKIHKICRARTGRMN